MQNSGGLSSEFDEIVGALAGLGLTFFWALGPTKLLHCGSAKVISSVGR
jgi:hypothetical protein